MAAKGPSVNDVGALLPSGSSFPFLPSLPPFLPPSPALGLDSPPRYGIAMAAVRDQVVLRAGCLLCLHQPHTVMAPAPCRVSRVLLLGFPSPSRSLAYDP